ncbi:MAG: hypothetical protein U0T85_07885 [Cloacibacterium normanense]
MNQTKKNILALEGKMEQVKHHLANLIACTIDYFTNIPEKIRKRQRRKTELRVFDNIDATKVVLANEKFYVNRRRFHRNFA